MSDPLKQLYDGINPSEARKATDQAERHTCFAAVAHDWRDARSGHWSPGHAERVWRDLEKDVLPWICQKPVHTITAPDLKAALKHIVERSALESAHRILQICGQVFHYAIISEQAEHNAVRTNHDRAAYLDERRQPLQAWSDDLDALAQGAVVIPIRRGVVNGGQ